MPTLLDIDLESMRISWRAPNNHGAPIGKYEVILADRQRVAKLKPLVNALNVCETEAEQKELIDKLLPKEHVIVMVEEFEAPEQPTHQFEELLGGLDYAVCLRAHNNQGWSDWSPALDTIRSPCAPPVESPSPWLLEATTHTLLVGFRIPYDNGDPITHTEIRFYRIAGPMERHMALGGKVTVSAQSSVQEKHEGSVLVSVPPDIERAEPEDYGGCGQGLLEGLAPGTEYDVEVRAINSHGGGEWSLSMRMVCSAGKPDRPSKMRHSSEEEVVDTHRADFRSRRRMEDSPVWSQELDDASPRGSPVPGASILEEQEDDASPRASPAGSIFVNRGSLMAQDEIISGVKVKKRISISGDA